MGLDTGTGDDPCCWHNLSYISFCAFSAIRNWAQPKTATGHTAFHILCRVPLLASSPNPELFFLSKFEKKTCPHMPNRDTGEKMFMGQQVCTNTTLDQVPLYLYESKSVSHSVDLTLGHPMNYSLWGSSTDGILQARMLEWVAIPFSRGSSWPGITPESPTLQADSLLSEPNREAFLTYLIYKYLHVVYLTVHIFPGDSGKESAYQCGRHGFTLWVRKIPWRRKWQPTPAFLSGKSHGQRNMVVYSPWSHKELDTT